MKKYVHRESSNIEYYMCIEDDLHMVLSSKDSKETIDKISRKISKGSLIVFDKIWGNYAMKLASSLVYKIAKVRGDTSEELIKIRNAEKEVKELLDKYIKEANPDLFLEAMSDISYWMAKILCERMIDLHKSYLISWVDWHKYLENKNKYENEGEKAKERLRIVLGDVVDNIEEIQKENNERMSKDFKDIFVNIDHEIDVEKSKMSPILNLPTRFLGEGEGFRVIKEYDKCVCLGSRWYTLKEYFEEIKHDIDEVWLKDKDLLKQIVVVYLIKKCQSGDDFSYEKLYSLYKDRVEEMEKWYIKNRGAKVDKEDVEGAGQRILTNLLKGDDPSFLYKYLGKNREEKKYITFLNKKPYNALNDSYYRMFNLFDGQYEVLKKELLDFEKNTKNIRNRSKIAKKDSSKKLYYQKIFSYSNQVLNRVSSATTMFALNNPLDFFNISPKYNKFLFRPAPNRNLTIWLLGTPNPSGEGKIFKGMIWQSLCSMFDNRKASVDMVNKTVYIKEMDSYVQNDSEFYGKDDDFNEDY